MAGTVRTRLIFAVCAVLILGTAYFLFGRHGLLRIREENLQKFYNLERSDPLIAGYPIDAARLERAVKLLEAVEKSNLDRAIVNARINQNGDAIGTLEQMPVYLMPMRFLKTLADVERSREEFMVRPTRANALRLLALQQNSARFYRDDALVLKKNLQVMIDAYGLPLDTRYIPLTQATITTPQTMLDDFGTIAENGDALYSEVAARRNCLYEGKCAEPRETTWESASEVGKIPLLPESILFAYRDNISEIKGPYRVPTTCFSSGANGVPVEQPFYLFREHWGSLPEFSSVKLATDIYYTKLPPAVEEDSLFSDFVKAGIDWYAHGEAPYRCNDLSYLFRLTTLNWLVSRLKQGEGVIAVQGAGPDSAAAREAKRIERDLIRSAEPRYEDGRKLGKLYEQILTEERNLPEDLRKRLADTVMALRSEYADFDRILLMVANYQAGLDEEMRIESSVDAHYLFSSRMYTSLAFLVHSPSIWRLEKRPTLVLRIPPDFTPEWGIKTFTELVKMMPEGELISQTVRKERIGSEFVAKATERFANDY